jgi:hypothetical protein
MKKLIGLAMLCALFVGNCIAQAANRFDAFSSETENSMMRRGDLYQSPRCIESKTGPSTHDSASLKLPPSGQSSWSGSGPYYAVSIDYLVPAERKSDWNFINAENHEASELMDFIKQAYGLDTVPHVMHPVGYGWAEFTLDKGKLTSSRVADLNSTNPNFKGVFDQLFKVIAFSAQKTNNPGLESPITFRVWVEFFPFITNQDGYPIFPDLKAAYTSMVGQVDDGCKFFEGATCSHQASTRCLPDGSMQYEF